MAFGHVNVVPPIDSDDVIGREQIGQPGGVAELDETGKLRESQIPTNVTEHIQDNNNPHGVTPHQIGAASNPNLLDNWYFADPINQRGKAIYTDVGYTIDRWYLGHKGGSGYPSVPQLSINNDGTITISNSSASYNTIFKQKIENIPAGTYTLSIMPVETTGTITFEAMRNGSSLGKIWVSSGYRQATFTIESDLNNLELVFSVSPNSSVKMKAVKLELGSQQTLAHQENGVWVLNEIPKYAEQMAICSQYDTNGNYIGHPTITSGTTDLVAGTSALKSGNIYLVYE